MYPRRVTQVRSWTPLPGEPHLLEWWRPLITFSRRARLDECAWPVHVDEFSFLGGVVRPSRAALFIFRHDRADRELVLDDDGWPYRFIPATSGRSAGRYVAAKDLNQGIWLAGIPGVTNPWPDNPLGQAWDEVPQPDDPEWEAPHERSVRDRRPQLRLVLGNLGDDEPTA